ncbi:hypothetical protein [Sagittula salina]|uniref:Uncharacterized protein n=1 Tax=Sagittula salina TaxID=2820268 RepID=A0A940MQJ2_9RHOB|nr:hypothetical protein [Sagittula salina]MBP0484018.1 hypothetical protein [Sagittula salina]
METREFLLGLVIFGILGAWAASARSQDVLPGGQVEGAAVGVFEAEDLTAWKKVQLFALGVANPSQLGDYTIAKKASLDDLAKLNGEQLNSVIADWIQNSGTLGVVTSDGALIGVKPFLVNSEVCPTCAFDPSTVVMRSKSGSVFDFSKIDMSVYSSDDDGSLQAVDSSSIVFLWEGAGQSIEPSLTKEILLKR